MLVGPGELLVEQSLQFGFKTSNNQAEYKALIAGLELAQDMGAKVVICKTDSQLTVGHITGEFQVKDPLLLKYYHKVKTLMKTFSTAKVEHVRREQNAPVDLLSKLASTKKRSQHKSIVQQFLESPSVGREESVCCITQNSEEWFEPIKRYITTGQCREEDELLMRMRCSRFMMVGSELYRRGYARPLLKCVTHE